MWKCPKCGRSFKKENQGHYCGKAPETVEDYIAAQDEDIRSQLQSVRQVLISSLPGAWSSLPESLIRLALNTARARFGFHTPMSFP